MNHTLGKLFRRVSALFGSRGPDYSGRLLAEQAAFRDCENVHDLPGIFHYWSNKYVLPMMQPFGFTSPDGFFFVYLHRVCRQDGGRPARIVSIGSGNCDLEIRLARQLKEAGIREFLIECIDLNPDMLERGRRGAREHGVEAQVGFTEADFNFWSTPPAIYDVVMANQSLHHVLELEQLFDAVGRGLKPEGRFLISDMIGRNGHMRWPEALELMAGFWRELPETCRYNQLMKRLENEFVNHDCSTFGF